MSIPYARTKAVIALQVVFGLFLTGFSGSIASANSYISHTSETINVYGKLPLSFETNQGQTNKQVKFLSHGPGYALFLTPTEAVLSLRTGHDQHVNKPSVLPVSSGSKSSVSKAAVLRIRLEHVNRNAKISGIDELASKSNYFIGKDPAKWRRNIPTFARVRYQEAYVGVDLVYYGNQRRLEYDFVLAPEADPRQIELTFAGATGLWIDAKGDLVVSIAGGEIVEHTPVIYQDISGMRRLVAGGYEIRSGHTVGFKLAAYDHRERLTIDPSLSYSTYLGGSDSEFAQGIAVDSSGNAYVTGFTGSSDFPTTTGALHTILEGGNDVFVSKLNRNGSALVYSTYLGGSGFEDGTAIAVDSSGNVYVAGSTNSSNFPTTPGALQTTFGGFADAFVSKLNSSGSALVYSTYLGGSDNEAGAGIAADSSGNTYVTGQTSSSDFPTTAGALQTSFNGGGFADAFVSKLNSSGSALVYSTYLGGSNGDFGRSIAIDSSGNAYVTGQTPSSDFPTTPGALQTTFGGGADAFVTKLNSSGSALVYSTYLGGSDIDLGESIAVDCSSNAYVTGETALLGTSSDFPITAGAVQTSFGGGLADAFVSKLNRSGSTLVYSTYLGGKDNEGSGSIAVDSFGNAYIVGQTFSNDFPVTAGALQITNSGEADAFVSKLNSSGSALVYSTYLGGSNNDVGYGVAVDSSHNAYIAGDTSSSNFPTAGPLQAKFGGGFDDAFVGKISFCSRPKTKKDCKHDGWQRFCEPLFKNQGQCVAFVNHHRNGRGDN